MNGCRIFCKIPSPRGFGVSLLPDFKCLNVMGRQVWAQVRPQFFADDFSDRFNLPKRLHEASYEQWVAVCRIARELDSILDEPWRVAPQ
jgi:hypothetical protein